MKCWCRHSSPEEESHDSDDTLASPVAETGIFGRKAVTDLNFPARMISNDVCYRRTVHLPRLSGKTLCWFAALLCVQIPAKKWHCKPEKGLLCTTRNTSKGKCLIMLLIQHPTAVLIEKTTISPFFVMITTDCKREMLSIISNTKRWPHITSQSELLAYQFIPISFLAFFFVFLIFFCYVNKTNPAFSLTNPATQQAGINYELF